MYKKLGFSEEIQKPNDDSAFSSVSHTHPASLARSLSSADLWSVYYFRFVFEAMSGFRLCALAVHVSHFFFFVY